ncbi:MAG TPA: thiosulfate oxidation carrier protein SoxY [Gammaproteobacteria bacterium]|nr:thiosulfate oxidation carrier protein SoxY [Gammaproteobacteria bacterium]
MKRRTFLKGTVAGGMLGVAASAGLLAPRMVLAAWPEKAFKAKTVDDALNALLGTSDLSESGDIKIKAPDIAENGAVVPITVSTDMKADSISVVIAKNPSPLACSFDLGSNTLGFVSTRVKMGKTSDLIAVVKSGGKLHSAKKTVKVTIGGCGG